MRLHGRFAITGIGALLLSILAIGCGADPLPTPEAGGRDAPCYGNGTCDPGLACVDGLCVTASGEDGAADAQGRADVPPQSDSTSGGPGDENLAPTLQITTPESGTIVEEGASVTLGASVSDDRDAPEDLRVQWGSNLQGALGEAEVSAGGASTFEVDTLVGGEHTLTATTTDSGGLMTSATLTLIVNAPPGAPTVTISPSEPTTTDDLTSELIEDAVDPNRASSELTLSWQWARDGEIQDSLTGPFVPSSATQKGETWQVRVRATDPYDASAEGTAQVSIANSAPSCALSVLLPSAGDTQTVFTCSCPERQDADGDTPQDRCAFLNGGEVLQEVNADDEGTCTLSPELTSRDMILTCAFTPSDGDADGEPVTSGEVTVQNSPPSAPGVTLSPDAGLVDTLFTCEVSDASIDADEDTLSYETTWYVGDHPNPGTGSTSVTPTQLVSDEAGTPARGGDTLRCEVVANDGSTIGPTGVSQSVTLGNSAPTGGSVVMGPIPADESTTLICTASEASDADGDTITWLYSWSVDGELVEGESSETLDGAHFDKGQVVLCTAAPTDGISEGAPVASKIPITIQNTAPSITGATLRSAEVTRGEALTCSAEGWSDPDPSDPPTFTYLWTHIGAEGPVTIEGAEASEITPGDHGLTPGDAITCTVTPIDSDTSGTAMTSAAATIINLPPTAPLPSLEPQSGTVSTTFSSP